MIIRIFYTKNLRNAEFAQLHSDNIALIEKFGAENMGIAALFATYKTLAVEYLQTNKRTVKSNFTKQIKDADAQRDKIYNATVEACKIMLRHFNKDVAEAALRLMNMFNSYGYVSKKSLTQQAAATTLVLSQLRSERYKNDVETVRISDWVDELENCNKAVDKLMKERFNEAAENAKLHSNKQLRNQVEKTYRAIAERINALIALGEEEPYKNYLRSHDVLTDHYRKTLKIRAAKSKSAREREKP